MHRPERRFSFLVHEKNAASDFILRPMKQIKLSGREQAVLRAIDYSVGGTGAEIHTATHIDTEELADILNGLCEVGYVEVFPHTERVNAATCATSRFEVNPSYALDLKAALRRN